LIDAEVAPVPETTTVPPQEAALCMLTVSELAKFPPPVSVTAKIGRLAVPGLDEGLWNAIAGTAGGVAS